MGRENNKLNIPKQMAQNKLIILYLFSKLKFRADQFQLMKINAENSLMNFFDLMECLFEMCESKLIEEIQTADSKYYTITKQGEQTLEIFKTELLMSTQKKIDAYCDEKLSELKLESETRGDFIKIRDDEYLITLKITENNSKVFEINLTVCSNRDANRIIENWQKNSLHTYQCVLELINS